MTRVRSQGLNWVVELIKSWFFLVGLASFEAYICKSSFFGLTICKFREYYVGYPNMLRSTELIKNIYLPQYGIHVLKMGGNTT